MVGAHTCAALTNAGWKVRALVRSPAKAAVRLAHLPVELHVGDIRDDASLEKAVRGCGSVVHLAAIAIERGDQTYAAVNTEGTKRVLAAASAARVDRFIHMSQNGANAGSPHAFLRSKGVAEAAVRESGVAYTVLRPSVIFGPEDEFVNVLARLVKLTPLIFPLPDGGRAQFQPIAVRDVAAAVRVSLERLGTRGSVYSLGGPVPLTLREMTERILAAMGARRAIVGIPAKALRPVLSVTSRLLPNPPVTPELLDLLALDNTVPDNALAQVFGISPTPFAPEELGYLRTITASAALSSLFEKR